MLLQDIKTKLRETGSELDIEIQDLIDAARADLMLSGVSEIRVHDDTDPLIKQAITVYCKAYFDIDSKEAPLLLQSYSALKSFLTLTEKYTEVTES